MNDAEIYKLTDITSMPRTGIEKISFEFYDAYTDIVYCTIKRCQKGLISVQSCAKSSDEALKNALELLEKVKLWDKILKMPDKNKQPYYHGYYREMLDNETQVEFKNIGSEFVITGIRRKDSDGFYYSEKPYPVKKEHTFVKDLSDETKLYTWNNIG